MRQISTSVGITALVLVFAMTPVFAKRHHAERPHHRSSPKMPPSPPIQAAPDAGDAYRNQIVEDGMTRDQLDRATGR